MPGLPGSTQKKDLELFKKLFSDERFKPDQLKIYPCQVMPGSELENLYWGGKYKPYTKEETEKLIIKMLKIVPRYCRVMRVMREIPPEYLVAGTTRIDLRREIEKELRKNEVKLNEIRYREIGFNQKFDNSLDLINNCLPSPNPPPRMTKELIKSVSKSFFGDLKLKTTKYFASGGIEYFLEIVNEEDILFGLLRMRIFDGDSSQSSHPPTRKVVALPTQKLLAHLCSQINKKSVNSKDSENYFNKDSNINGVSAKKSGEADFEATNNRAEKRAIIRELHVYGPTLKLGEKGEISQHRGFGKWLLEEAEEIVKKERIKKLKIISGVGVREYYRKFGYFLNNDCYMEKGL